MSVKAISAVFEHSESKGDTRLVLLAMADFADDYGLCWPAWERIALKSRVHRATVARSLDWAEKHGEIVRLATNRGRSRSNIYELLLPGLLEWDEYAEATYEAVLKGRTVQPIRKEGVASGNKGVASGSSKGRNVRQALRKEPLVNVKSRYTKSGAQAHKGDPNCTDCGPGWICHRHSGYRGAASD